MKITKEDLIKLCHHFGDEDCPSDECDCYQCIVVNSCAIEGDVVLSYS